VCTPNDRLCSEAHSSSLRTSEDNASAELTGLSSLLCLLSWQHLKLNKREIINLYRFGNKDAEGRLAFKSWMEGFRNTTGVHAMRSVPEFLKPKASRCSVHGSPWQWEETPKESLTIHKVRSLNHATAHQAAFHQHSIGSPCFVPSSHANHSLAEKGGCVQGFLLEPGPCSIARLTAFARGRISRSSSKTENNNVMVWVCGHRWEAGRSRSPTAPQHTKSRPRWWASRLSGRI